MTDATLKISEASTTSYNSHRDRGLNPAGGEGGGPTKREFLFKILVIGELGAGKTAFIKRYVHQIFSDHYRATIGVDFALKAGIFLPPPLPSYLRL